ncbi:uncharacterized protein LOC144429829 [Styela clava]
MADLPSCRFVPGKKPFEFTFVDYFCPIKVKFGQNEYKSYGCRGEKELRDGIRNWNQHVIDESLSQKGIQWHFSPPLASHQSGVVERLVREVKKTLRAITDSRSFTDYSLWSFLTGVREILNDGPFTPLSDDPTDLNVLTPNSILIAKLDPSLPSDKFMKTDEYRTTWRYSQRLLGLFWDRWRKEHLPLLQELQKWHSTQRNLQVGDLVLMIDDSSPRNHWPKAIVDEKYPDKHGIVRRSVLQIVKCTYTHIVRNAPIYNTHRI